MESQEIIVSVAMITYNHERFVAHAIESIVKQKTDFPFELIIHDDASKDSTAEIIKKYAAMYPDVIVPILQEENQYSKGVHFIPKYIYPKVRGKYYAFCEGDDYWTDMNRLQKQVDYLETHTEIVSVAARNLIIDKNDNILGISHEGENLNRLFTAKDAIRLGTNMLHLSTMMRRSSVLFDENYLTGKKCCKLGSHSFDIYYFSYNGGVYIMDAVFSAWRKVIEQNGDSFSSRNAKHSISFGIEHIRTLKNYQVYFGSAYDFSNKIVENAEMLVLALLMNKEDGINKLSVFVELWRMLSSQERKKLYIAVKQRIIKKLIGKKNER